MIELIYIRGGDKTAPILANETGWHYGVRHDYVPYGDVYMLDIHWTDYDWSEYMNIVFLHEPIQAMVADLEHESQIEQMLNQCADLLRIGVRPCVCQKFDGAVKHIPLGAIVAVSVPTSYAGFLPSVDELNGREIHLLGGNPINQADLIVKYNGIGGRVISLDTNYHARKSQLGQFFNDDWRWVQSNKGEFSNFELSKISMINMNRFFETVEYQKQFKLF